ncbi:MAG TPA: type II toxin-antitoxin system VapC family toxin [Acidimicrobiales bacterium]|nr:type II toxin-antitoxin system VapC family toxin [Acidimicrobiales bacterium]
MAEQAVVDASAFVDLLLGGPLGDAVARRVSGRRIHGPAHLDAEVLSALGRLNRAGALRASTVATMLGHLADAPIERHPLAGLLAGAWGRRSNLRLADALYVELAAALDVPLVTTDARLRPVLGTEVVTA